MKYYWLRTLDKKWYVFELRGTIHVSWVLAKDKSMSNIFPENLLEPWKKIIKEMTGEDVEEVEPFT